MRSAHATIAPQQVHEILKRHLLVDGYDLVVDIDRSHGAILVDSRFDRQFVDFFSFFGSFPIGFNHPKMKSPEFQAKLAHVASLKPSISDVYFVEMAEFVATFERVGIPTELPHLFVIEGGTLAVENALKAAFDWKIRKNLARGKGEKGTQVIHFRQAFHGRSGYTLSLTNTADPRKTMYFPKFDWPRIENPKILFPLEGANLDGVVAAEKRAVSQIEEAFLARPDDIAAIIIEPIQAEGGDNHFRPEFLAELRRLADENEALLIFDEVQTGVGLTGKFWAYEHFGVVPDLLAFGKKMQVCGVLAGKRLDQVERNVFVEPSRINSTFGGNLTDMVRASRYLEIIEEEDLVGNARQLGAYLLHSLQGLASEMSGFVTSPRGRGLFCAFDLPSPPVRDALRKTAYERGLILLGCGTQSIRFRPSLAITRDELDSGLKILRDSLRAVRS
ncbi:MAG: L-lysine 6-transaminase [Planctomycetes bacterium]|nr:L-lysine 6-transaminase [Planctomycetota bacterium]MBI3845784.1 L-lysine 6-transaminase [Planctomycetota bacterium]